MKITVNFGKSIKNDSDENLTPIELLRKEEKKLTRMEKRNKVINTASTVAMIAGFGVCFTTLATGLGAKDGAFGQAAAEFVTRNANNVMTAIGLGGIVGISGFGAMITNDLPSKIIHQQHKVDIMKSNIEKSSVIDLPPGDYEVMDDNASPRTDMTMALRAPVQALK